LCTSLQRSYRVQTEAALAVDALNVLYRGVARLHAANPSAFKHTLRDNKFYNNGSEGIDCDAEPVDVWRHGNELMKAMRQVRVYIYYAGFLTFSFQPF